MTDETKEVVVKLSLPKRWTLGQFDQYSKVRAEHIEKGESTLIARFHGAMALINAGYVHVDGEDVLKKATADPDTTDLAVVGFIIVNIASKIEAALDNPLPDWTAA